MLEDYNQRQVQAEQEYRQAYAAWLASMTPEEREQLAARGLAEPDLPKHHGSGVSLDLDAADSHRASCGQSILEEIAQPDPDDGISPEDLRVMEVIQRLIGELVSDKNPQLAVECLALTTGIAYRGNSLTEIAMRHDITRAAVSKRCLDLADRLGVKNRRALRSDRACEAYFIGRIESLKRQGKTYEPNRRERQDLLGSLAVRARAAFDKLDDWLEDASAGELLLVRRSLRPVLGVADQLAAMIRRKNDPSITRQLEADMAGGGKESP